ncbi:hypothetical protein BD779DRAFT_1474400 [Infundibulicybe gibba]|nr:hypothetical protein BD779DRAFT_1474400 [Infundibulicybe gibba]
MQELLVADATRKEATSASPNTVSRFGLTLRVGGERSFDAPRARRRLWDIQVCGCLPGNSWSTPLFVGKGGGGDGEVEPCLQGWGGDGARALVRRPCYVANDHKRTRRALCRDRGTSERLRGWGIKKWMSTVEILGSQCAGGPRRRAHLMPLRTLHEKQKQQHPAVLDAGANKEGVEPVRSLFVIVLVHVPPLRVLQISDGHHECKVHLPFEMLRSRLRGLGDTMLAGWWKVEIGSVSVSGCKQVEVANIMGILDVKTCRDIRIGIIPGARDANAVA